jgi:hypothetical protein
MRRSWIFFPLLLLLSAVPAAGQEPFSTWLLRSDEAVRFSVTEPRSRPPSGSTDVLFGWSWTETPSSDSVYPNGGGTTPGRVLQSTAGPRVHALARNRFPELALGPGGELWLLDAEERKAPEWASVLDRIEAAYRQKWGETVWMQPREIGRLGACTIRSVPVDSADEKREWGPREFVGARNRTLNDTPFWVERLESLSPWRAYARQFLRWVEGEGGTRCPSATGDLRLFPVPGVADSATNAFFLTIEGVEVRSIAYRDVAPPDSASAGVRRQQFLEPSLPRSPVTLSGWEEGDDEVPGRVDLCRYRSVQSLCLRDLSLRGRIYTAGTDSASLPAPYRDALIAACREALGRGGPACAGTTTNGWKARFGTVYRIGYEDPLPLSSTLSIQSEVHNGQVRWLLDTTAVAVDSLRAVPVVLPGGETNALDLSDLAKGGGLSPLAWIGLIVLLSFVVGMTIWWAKRGNEKGGAKHGTKLDRIWSRLQHARNRIFPWTDAGDKGGKAATDDGPPPQDDDANSLSTEAPQGDGEEGSAGGDGAQAGAEPLAGGEEESAGGDGAQAEAEPPAGGEEKAAGGDGAQAGAEPPVGEEEESAGGDGARAGAEPPVGEEEESTGGDDTQAGTTITAPEDGGGASIDGGSGAQTSDDVAKLLKAIEALSDRVKKLEKSNEEKPEEKKKKEREADIVSLVDRHLEGKAKEKVAAVVQTAGEDLTSAREKLATMLEQVQNAQAEAVEKVVQAANDRFEKTHLAPEVLGSRVTVALEHAAAGIVENQLRQKLQSQAYRDEIVEVVARLQSHPEQIVLLRDALRLLPDSTVLQEAGIHVWKPDEEKRAVSGALDAYRRIFREIDQLPEKAKLYEGLRAGKRLGAWVDHLLHAHQDAGMKGWFGEFLEPGPDGRERTTARDEYERSQKAARRFANLTRPVLARILDVGPDRYREALGPIKPAEAMHLQETGLAEGTSPVLERFRRFLEPADRPGELGTLIAALQYLAEAWPREHLAAKQQNEFQESLTAALRDSSLPPRFHDLAEQLAAGAGLVYRPVPLYEARLGDERYDFIKQQAAAVSLEERVGGAVAGVESRTIVRLDRPFFFTESQSGKPIYRSGYAYVFLAAR